MATDPNKIDTDKHGTVEDQMDGVEIRDKDGNLVNIEDMVVDDDWMKGCDEAEEDDEEVEGVATGELFEDPDGEE